MRINIEPLSSPTVLYVFTIAAAINAFGG